MWHMKWSLACLSVLTCCTWLSCGPVRWHPLEGEYPDTAVGKLQRLAWVSVLCGVGVSAALLPLVCDDQDPALACCAPCSSPLIDLGLSRWSSPSSLSILETAERHACVCIVTSGSCLTFQWSTSLAGYSIQEVQISSCELEMGSSTVQCQNGCVTKTLFISSKVFKSGHLFLSFVFELKYSKYLHEEIKYVQFCQNFSTNSIVLVRI